MLADTGREVLLDWEEHEAVINLKAFQMSPQRMIALDVTWAQTPDAILGVVPELQGALSRLTTEVEQQ